MKKCTYTFDLVILSPVVRKVKDVNKMYKKVLISIMEKRMPIHDYRNVSSEVNGGSDKLNTRSC
jgi:phosphohistidine phosphatase SixA